MVQLKYFGDDRDYFKYDLITSVVQGLSLQHYVYVPMLTVHRDDDEGRIAPRNIFNKSQELFEFIGNCPTKSLTHWRTWLAPTFVNSYDTIMPEDETYFCDERRSEYWHQCRTLIGKKNALIFVDPDTGLESGSPSYLEQKGREKYILNAELIFLIQFLHTTSILMVYQHLPRNRHEHVNAVKKKLRQVRIANSSTHSCAYREDDLAFIFISKTSVINKELLDILTVYHDNSTHPYKSLPHE